MNFEGEYPLEERITDPIGVSLQASIADEHAEVSCPKVSSTAVAMLMRGPLSVSIAREATTRFCFRCEDHRYMGGTQRPAASRP